MPPRPDECIVGDVLPGNYTVKQPLGKGGYGYVCYAQKDGQDYAVKVQAADQSAYTEVSLLSALDHPNIIKVAEVIYLPIDADQVPAEPKYRDVLAHFYLYQPKGNAKMPAGQDPITSTFHLLSALAYLESNGIIHGDIKPQNVVFLGQEPVIIDFGITQFCPGSQRIGHFFPIDGKPRQRFQFQTSWYRAPEVWRQDNYDSRVDVWSLGCCLYEWLAKTPLFTAQEGELDKFEQQLLDMPAKITALLTELAKSSEPKWVYVLEQLFFYMLAPRSNRLFAHQLLNFMYQFGLVPPAPSRPAKFQYPYTSMYFRIPEDERVPAMLFLQERLQRAGLVQKVARPGVEFEDDNNTINTLTELQARTRQLNNDAWVVLAFPVVEQLYDMAVSREEVLVESFIPGGDGKGTDLTWSRAVTMAVYLLTSYYNREIYDHPVDVANILAEFYDHTDWCLFPKYLLTVHSFANDEAFVNSVSAEVIPIYRNALLDAEWTRLSPEEAKESLKEAANAPVARSGALKRSRKLTSLPDIAKLSIGS